MTDDYKKEAYWKLVEEFVAELQTANYWMKPDGKPLPEWRLFETRDAALRGAAWDAAWDAALRGAAWDAAWGAALRAAWNADLRGAAWDAALRAAWGAALRGAAWDAALRGAAWDAARDAALRDAARDAALFAGMLVCVGLRVEVKHLVHVNARMRVWRKGYGLLCDLNGVLYVYKSV